MDSALRFLGETFGTVPVFARQVSRWFLRPTRAVTFIEGNHVVAIPPSAATYLLPAATLRRYDVPVSVGLSPFGANGPKPSKGQPVQHPLALTGPLSVVYTLQESVRTKAPGSWLAEVEEKALDYAVGRLDLKTDPAFLLYDVRRNARTSVARGTRRYSGEDVQRCCDERFVAPDPFEAAYAHHLCESLDEAVGARLGDRGRAVLQAMLADEPASHTAELVGVNKRTIERTREQVREIAAARLSVELAA